MLPTASLSVASIFRAKTLFLERICYLQSGMERAGSGLRIGQGPTLARRGTQQPGHSVPLGEEEEEEEEVWGRTLLKC